MTQPTRLRTKSLPHARIHGLPMRHLAPLILLLAAACGGSDPKALTDAGVSALGSGDAKSALASFDDALAHMPANDPQLLRASLGRVQALARTEPAKAKEAFLALTESQKSKINEGDFGLVVSELLRKNANVEAVDVMNAGVKMFPESTKMLAVKTQVLEQSKKSNDPAALQKLRGLGYGGDLDH